MGNKQLLNQKRTGDDQMNLHLVISARYRAVHPDYKIVTGMEYKLKTSWVNALKMAAKMQEENIYTDIKIALCEPHENDKTKDFFCLIDPVWVNGKMQKLGTKITQELFATF